MAVLVDRNDRKLVPAWKPFNVSSPEVQPIKFQERPQGDIGEYISEWVSHQNIANAGDLLTAAIVQNRSDIPEVTDAARYVLNSETFVPHTLRTQAVSFANSPSDIIVDHQNLDVFKKIAELKSTLIKYPADAITHIEIARCYLTLGILSKTELHIRYALFIDSNNRYVVRCATRFYIHIRKWEDALRVVRKSSLVQYDPWLLATEISISQINKKTSRNIKKGQNLIASNNYSAFDLTELRAAIGTEEYMSGAYSKSRRLFNDSLLNPNSNSLAQARWIVSNKGLELNFDRVDLCAGQFIEAKSYQALEKGNYTEALNDAREWLKIEPYSTRAVLYAYNIAVNYLEDTVQGEELLKDAIGIHKTNPVLLNDYAFTLAYNGKSDEASAIINKIKLEEGESSDFVDIYVTATKGMIAFRHFDQEKGDKLYAEAIQKSIEKTKDPSITQSAILNYCRELLLCDNSNEHQRVVKDLLGRIPDNDVIELTKLKKQVTLLLE